MNKSSLRRLLIGEFTWKRFVRSALFIYIFFALYVFFRADSMIFLPPPASYQDTQDILKVPVTNNEQISALYFPNPDAAYTLLYIHGNAEDLGDIRPRLVDMYRWGFSVFAYDYRGYGTSDGKPSERNAYEDVNAAYAYLTQQLNVPGTEIIVYGRSVGGGSATALASQQPVAGLILESSFTSAFRVVFPIPLLPFDKFPNLQRLKNVRAPVLVMHGQADAIIPFHHGQKLYAAAPEPKDFLWVPGAGHNDFAGVSGDRLEQALVSFQQVLGR